MNKQRRRAEIKKKRLSEDQKLREDLLARELRIMTKGTAAAKAVFTSFVRNPEYEAARKARSSHRAGQAMTAHLQGATKPRKPRARRTSRHTKNRTSSQPPGGAGRYLLTSNARTALTFTAALDRRKEAPEESWNRHALAFFGKTTKEKATLEHLSAKRFSSTSASATTQGTLGDTRTARSPIAVGAAAAEYHERARQPEQLAHDLSEFDPTVPAVTDAKFTDWVRLRFGRVST